MPPEVPAASFSSPPVIVTGPLANALVEGEPVGSMSSRPALTIVPPLYVFVPLRAKVPGPFCCRTPPVPGDASGKSRRCIHAADDERTAAQLHTAAGNARQRADQLRFDR